MNLKTGLILFTLLVLTSCGPRRAGSVGAAGAPGANGTNGFNGADGADGQSCSVEEAEGGAIITCGESLAVILNGAKGDQGEQGQAGADGQNGQDGEAGQNGTNGQDGLAGLNGADGQNGSDGATGATGQDGQNGTDGQNGQDGLAGTNGQDGAQGQAGANGADGISPVLAVIDPCGDKAGKADEILLKTSSGIISYFEADGKKMLALLAPGSYTTTDAQECRFSVNANGTVSF